MFLNNLQGVRLRQLTLKLSDFSQHRSKILRELDLLYLLGFRPLRGLTLLKAKLNLLDHWLDQLRVPWVRSVSTVPCPAADVTLHMYFIVASSMSIGSILAQLGSRRPLIRAVGLSSLAFPN